MIKDKEYHYKEFRNKMGMARFFSLSVAFSAFISFVLILNQLQKNLKFFQNEWVYVIALLLIIVASMAAYVYLYDYRLRKALQKLNPILFDEVDPQAFTDYLEKTMNFDKKNISPSLWIAYLMGLSYLNDQKKMAFILREHEDILKGNVEYKIYEFSLYPPDKQRREFKSYFNAISKHFKDTSSLEIKSSMLNHDYEKANTLLDQYEPTSNLDKVSWHHRKALVLYGLKQKEAAQVHIDYVIEHGNTSYYVKEAENLKLS